MLAFIPKELRRRCLALVTATAVVAGGLIAASTQPVSAQTSQTAQVAAAAPTSTTIPTGPSELCLANANGSCVGVPVEDIINNTLDVIGKIAPYILIYLTWRDKGKGDGGEEGEEQDEGASGDGDPDAGLCFADTGGNAFMTACGANGTIWVAVTHNDGDYLYSRYTVNQGHSEGLTAQGTNPGTRLYVTVTGGPDWQTWNWYSTSRT
jgi:hypothetical protein